MLAEGVHSLADTSNQLLLLRGGQVAKREATEEHPFGYGRAPFISAFLVSVILFSLGGLFALLGTIDKGAEVVQSLPFAARSSEQLVEIKALSLTLVFVHAFLRFTWSLRQFNLVNIVIGAYPSQRDHLVADDRMIDQAARLNELAGANFTQGLRTYYFAIPLLLWLVNPWFLVIGAFVITAASYWMEFRSATVGALADDTRR